MTSVTTVIAVATAYVGLLFLIAVWAERQEKRGRSVASNALVYSLSLAVYHTTWTYYGSVGLAASSGLLFLGVYIGPTLTTIFWWQLLRKMVRIKNAHRVTSVVDLLSLRYGRSQSVAVLATLALLCGLVPYISLQLKTMIATVALLTGHDQSRAYSMGTHVGLPIVLLMILFTIVFGIRRLSPTERHPGMMVALGAEGVVKLVAFVAAGAFVTFGLFHGFGDVFRRAGEAGVLPELLGRKNSIATWLSHILASMAAILFLPRQFHVAVVENSDENHIRTAVWLFPLYMLAINLFVLPLALGGLLLGHSAGAADWFVLSLPHAARTRWLSWLVFLGGFSAGTGMVMAETMALATMVSNHLFLPAMNAWRPLGGLRRHLLGARWCAAALVILAAFAYERAFGSQYELVSIGLVSFSAVLMFALPLAGGLYWRGASTAGALGGLATGFGAWGYTLVVPVFVRAGWLPQRLLTEGPWGISALRPEALFGLGWLDRVPHATFWIIFFGAGAFVLGSLFFPASAEEESRADRLAEALERPDSGLVEAGQHPLADAAGKRARIVGLFAQYHGEAVAERLADACLGKVGISPKGQVSALQLASLEAEVETTLASFIGTAGAHATLQRERLATPVEARAISTAYAEILAALKVPPAELQRKIDYHRERERMLAHEATAQRLLSTVSGKLAASLDVETTGDTVVHLLVPQLADAALLWIAQGDDEEPRVWFADADPDRERTVRPGLKESLPAIRSHACVARAMETGRPVATPREPRGTWPAHLFQGTSFSGDATFPLVLGEKILGTLTLFLSDRSRFRTAEDLALGEELAHRSVMALENAALFRSADEAVRARDEFLAVASHELKTPLTPLWLNIQALQRLVARDELDKIPKNRLDDALRGAEGQIQRLVGLVDDLLDVSRITTRRLRLNLEITDLGAVVRNVLDRHQSELAQAGCDLSLAISPDVIGFWDRTRIEQVFTNLLTNAMKYAPGPIEIRVESDAATARLVVSDQGPGIAPEDRERIFLAFERAVSYLKASGFGLGLYIVRQIVDAHGGVVRLDSAPGRGSTFVVELPRNAPASA
jgi:signal transduction histidine kinase/Na+/proline symporter